MKLSPGIYSKKESYKTESHKTNLTALTAHKRMEGTYIDKSANLWLQALHLKTE